MAIDFVAIGQNLRRAREARAWTQTQAGRKLGVSGAAVSLVESGESHGIKTIERYAELLGCPFVLHVGAHADARSALLARLARSLDKADDGTVETISAWIDIWERRSAAGVRVS